MKYNIYITNSASIMMKKHVKFLSKKSIKSAINLKSIFIEHIIILKYFPKIGQKIYRNNTKIPRIIRKMIINKRYINLFNL